MILDQGLHPDTPQHPTGRLDLVMKRDKEIKIRVTAAELAAIRERCDRPQLAEWLRDLALGQRKRRPVPVADPKLLRQLAAIGSNLNQVARWCNGRTPIEAAEVSMVLVAINRELEALYANQNQR